MKQKKLSELTDQELLAETKKRKTSSIVNAVVIGFMVAVIGYSIVKNTWGLVTLIPLFFIYRLTKNQKDEESS